ncbi:wax ester/triacylglycerol synthase family O-acyltransferase [Kineobactrum sediminis]|uniref:diacylglycerol O-acyltransferase n=1 Tax=Kineobactrum sediminis TaxID=1905677 RepID=A0A2N5Y5P2_9GAMM|nr:wax ester/triacylglycerol synthase family O-acyltransferase [Kineobactrum sediminis]PLW83714.1 wax ester/triacylglycerol synthase family O-acyltransferase [Kineobactrum sediminis]
MHQLSGLDATFLYAEVNNSPMHIAPLTIYDPSTTGTDVVRFKDILQTFANRLHRSPVFKRKLAMVPLNLDQPYWVEDENFDLEFHVRHIALPKPGDWRQLCILVARLHARPLDRARPLWEAYVIEGLDNVAGLPKGCFAMFLKIHHAAIDGASGVEIISAIHDLTPVPPPPREEAPPPMDRGPGNLEMLWRAYKANLRAPLQLARLVTQGIPAWRRVHAGVKAKKFRTLGEKERTRFNAAISPHRVFGAADFDLALVRQMKEAATGATVNDVILSIVGGALRLYLLDKQELPERSLVAGAPVNVRPQTDTGSAGNQVSMMSIALRTDITDPLARLQAVHDEAVGSKAYHQAVGARLMTDMTQSLPAELAALAVRAALGSGLMAGMKPIFNTIVTNVPGPQVPLYMGGAKVVRSYGLGPCADNLGLFHAVTSYNGQIAIAFQACRQMMPDPGFYEQCLYDAYKALQQAVGIQLQPKTRVKTKTKTKIKTKTGTRATTKARAKTQAKTKSRAKSGGKESGAPQAGTTPKAKPVPKPARSKTGTRSSAVRPKRTTSQ